MLKIKIALKHPTKFRSKLNLHDYTIDFLMITGGIEVTQFARIRLILQAKFDDTPLLEVTFSKLLGAELKPFYHNSILNNMARSLRSSILSAT